MAGLGATMRCDEYIGDTRRTRDGRERGGGRDEPVEQDDSTALGTTNCKACEKRDLEAAECGERIAACIDLEPSPDDLDLVRHACLIEAGPWAAHECWVGTRQRGDERARRGHVADPHLPESDDVDLELGG